MRSPYTTLIPLVLAACGGTSAASRIEAPAPMQSESVMAEDEWGAWEEDGSTAPHAAGRRSHGSAIEILGGIQPPPTPWAEMSYDQREFLMVGVILPITDEMITDFDAPRGETFGCQNCHGSDMRERHFQMPSTQRMPIPAAGTPAYDMVRSSFPDIVDFMEERFTEDVGTLLGVDSFTCNSCHPTVG